MPLWMEYLRVLWPPILGVLGLLAIAVEMRVRSREDKLRASVAERERLLREAMQGMVNEHAKLHVRLVKLETVWGMVETRIAKLLRHEEED
jgi:hypothetical protein